MRRTDSDVTQGEQSSNLGAALLDEVEGELDASAAIALHFALHDGAVFLKSLQDQSTERGRLQENLLDGATQNLAAGTPQEALGGGADQHDPRVAGEQHEAVLQLGHHLLHVVLEGGEDLIGVPHLPPQVGDLQGHQSVLVVAGLAIGKQIGGAGAHAVEITAEFFQRAEGEVGDGGREEERKNDGYDGEEDGMPELGSDFTPQEDGRYPDAHTAERDAVELKRQADVVDGGRAIHHPELSPRNVHRAPSRSLGGGSPFWKPDRDCCEEWRARRCSTTAAS